MRPRPIGGCRAKIKKKIRRVYRKRIFLKKIRRTNSNTAVIFENRTLLQPPQPITFFLLIYVWRRRDCTAKRNKTTFREQRPACKFNLLPIKPPHKKPAFTGSHTWLLFMTNTQRLDVRLNNCFRRKNWMLHSRFNKKESSMFIHFIS